VRGAASVAAIGLAVVFLWAAASKFVRRAQTADAFQALRLPAPVALATLVPVAETAIAAALLAVPNIGGALALAALGGFTFVIVRALGTGAPCACFGSNQPVSPADVVRNGWLAAFAAIATATTRLVAPTPAAAAVTFAAAALAVTAQTALRRRMQA
jgi:hypothetical protein